jgi:hypothetical protein
VSQPYQPNPSDPALQLAQRCVTATTVKDFAIVISEANLILNKQEWNRFIAECWRLKAERKQREEPQ